MSIINKEHKDRLFSFVFGSESNKEWTLSLYNAINNTGYTEPEDIQFTTIEDAVYMGMKNDLSFILFHVMNIYEQQSAYNPNMPVRQLMYAGKLYDKYIQRNKLNIYGKRLVHLPIPKLIVFYNGSEGKEDALLKLSDAFEAEGEVIEADIEVKDMCIAEYNEAETMQMLREESREEERMELLVEMVSAGDVSVEKAAKYAKMSIEQFSSYGR